MIKPSKAPTMKYTYRDWKNGAALPYAFKCHQAVSRYGWLTKEIDAMLISILPGKSASNGQAQWADRDMHSNGWRVLPYGFGYEADGTATLFDREYRPICSIDRRGDVRMMAPTAQEWRAAEKVFLYDDGAKPRYNRETRRLIGGAVERLGLGAELKRRAILERLRLLPTAGGVMPRRPADLRASWVPELERVIVGKAVFSFDMASGEVLRIRRPVAAGEAWAPRPVNDQDVAGVVSWLRSKGMRASGKGVAAVIDAVAASRPCLYLPAQQEDAPDRLSLGASANKAEFSRREWRM